MQSKAIPSAGENSTLEFINTVGDIPVNDAETRRKVRSQAMKDYRQRQKGLRIVDERLRCAEGSRLDVHPVVERLRVHR